MVKTDIIFLLNEDSGGGISDGLQPPFFEFIRALAKGIKRH